MSYWLCLHGWNMRETTTNGRWRLVLQGESMMSFPGFTAEACLNLGPCSCTCQTANGGTTSQPPSYNTPTGKRPTSFGYGDSVNQPSQTTSGSNQVSTGGAIGCPKGATNCAGSCVDLFTNNTNCGQCGHVCPTGTVCNGLGVCKPPNAP